MINNSYNDNNNINNNNNDNEKESLPQEHGETKTKLKKILQSKFKRGELDEKNI